MWPLGLMFKHDSCPLSKIGQAAATVVMKWRPTLNMFERHWTSCIVCSGAALDLAQQTHTCASANAVAWVLTNARQIIVEWCQRDEIMSRCWSGVENEGFRLSNTIVQECA